MKPFYLPPEPKILVVAMRRLDDVLLTIPLIGQLQHLCR
jgi:hypothetical protein